jgi:hypothetical protein
MLTPECNGSQPLLLAGIYMPCQDVKKQDAVFAQLQSTLTTHPTVLALLAGDWNMDMTDNRLTAFIAANNLTKINIVATAMETRGTATRSPMVVKDMEHTAS